MGRDGFADLLLPAQAAEPLRQVAGQDERRSGIGEKFAGACDERGCGDGAGGHGPGAIATAEIHPPLRVEPARVVEQVADRHVVKGALVAGPEIGGDGDDGRLDGKPPGLQHLKQHEGGDDLGDGAELEGGLLADGSARAQVRHAFVEAANVAAGLDREGNAGGSGLAQPVLQEILHGVSFPSMCFPGRERSSSTVFAQASRRERGMLNPCSMTERAHPPGSCSVGTVRLSRS